MYIDGDLDYDFILNRLLGDILVRACTDYIVAVKRKNKNEISILEKFFTGQDFYSVFNLNGYIILKKLQSQKTVKRIKDK